MSEMRDRMGSARKKGVAEQQKAVCQSRDEFANRDRAKLGSRVWLYNPTSACVLKFLMSIYEADHWNHQTLAGGVTHLPRLNHMDELILRRASPKPLLAHLTPDIMNPFHRTWAQVCFSNSHTASDQRESSSSSETLTDQFHFLLGENSQFSSLFLLSPLGASYAEVGAKRHARRTLVSSATVGTASCLDLVRMYEVK